MKKEYWNISNEQVVEKTGKDINYQIKALTDFNAKYKKSNYVVSNLHENHQMSSYWAQTLTTLFLKSA